MQGQGEGRIRGVVAAGWELHDTASEHVIPAHAPASIKTLLLCMARHTLPADLAPVSSAGTSFIQITV